MIEPSTAVLLLSVLIVALGFIMIYQARRLDQLQDDQTVMAAHLAGLQHQCDELQRRLDRPLQGGANIPKISADYPPPDAMLSIGSYTENPESAAMMHRLRRDGVLPDKTVGQINDDGSITDPNEPYRRAQAMEHLTGIPAGTAFTRYDQGKGWPK